MTVPDYQSMMLPLLKLISDQKEHSLPEMAEKVGKYFELSEKDMKELLPSRTQTIIYSRVQWARTYMKKAGLIEATGRGRFSITTKGLDVLKQNPVEINVKFLMQFPEFSEFRSRPKTEEDASNKEAIETDGRFTPAEYLEFNYQNIRENLALELLERVKNSPPKFFEHLVVDLLVKMGYGGSRSDAGTAVGKSGDEGVDGIIKEDRLGLDVIYVQAKRWENPVGRPEIQKFVGALEGHRAKKGVFITTPEFSRDAKDYVEKINSKIILIDGEQLAKMMIDHSVGVSTIAAYEVKKIDSDYFSDE